MKDGIFANFRKKNIDVSKNNLFQISSPDNGCTGTRYCNYYINSRPPYSIVDGNYSTAWASLEQNSQNNKYLDFAFFQHKVNIHAIAIQTLCGPPPEIKIQGSNNNGETWEEVCHHNIRLPENDTTEILCLSSKYFSLFRLSQIGMSIRGNNLRTYRFHVHNIEMYGLLSTRQNTCGKLTFHYEFLYIMVIVLFSK